MKKINLILQNWDLDRISEINKIPKGNVNTSYQIHTKKDNFVLKVSDLDDSTDQLLEFEYLKYLDSVKFPYSIPIPLKTINNQFFVEIENKIYWIYKLIPGRFCSEYNKLQISEIGKLLGIYHKIISKSEYKLAKTSNNNYPYTFNLSDIKNNLDLITKKISQTTFDKEYLKFSDSLIDIYHFIDHERMRKLEYYRIHRDINPDNILWDETRLIGLIDFENVKSHFDPLIKGLAVSLSTFCLNKNSFKPNFEYYDILIANYKKFGNFIDIETEILVDLILEGLIEDYNYVYWLINNKPGKVNDLSMNYYKEALIWYRNHYKEVINNLCKFNSHKN